MKIESVFKEEHRLPSKNKVTKLDYEHYIYACYKIAEDIKSKYDLSKNNIELIGLARGGLPLLVTISHILNIREVYMIQTKMSNSDNCHDYGVVRYLSDNLTNKPCKCILLEDIIFKGNTTNAAINIVKEKHKEVLEVYTLVMDEKMKELEITNKEVPLNYAYTIDADDWVYFFWETDIRKINEG